ncbi:hypothetical protein TNCT_240321 [Trichonephila clavata]|uniref:Uncharacterized protein n=1 Tax=Trichonephila clavata TaxID=2740835 RepID=A0A8X6L0L3_TRICU|nr:hypothetical protein TNCT_240321 [Trichonephila clavata]
MNPAAFPRINANPLFHHKLMNATQTQSDPLKSTFPTLIRQKRNLPRTIRETTMEKFSKSSLLGGKLKKAEGKEGEKILFWHLETCLIDF